MLSVKDVEKGANRESVEKLKQHVVSSLQRS